jgi:hypothetical protein
MKIEEDGAGKAQSQKALRELESQLAEVREVFSIM